MLQSSSTSHIRHQTRNIKLKLQQKQTTRADDKMNNPIMSCRSQSLIHTKKRMQNVFYYLYFSRTSIKKTENSQANQTNFLKTTANQAQGIITLINYKIAFDHLEINRKQGHLRSTKLRRSFLQNNFVYHAPLEL